MRILSKVYRGLKSDHINEFAKENSATEIQLQVFAFNKSAHDFYEELGFSDMAMIMCKNIT